MPIVIALLEAIDELADDHGWTTRQAIHEHLALDRFMITSRSIDTHLAALEDTDLVDHQDGRWGLGGDGWDLLHLGIAPGRIG